MADDQRWFQIALFILASVNAWILGYKMGKYSQEKYIKRLFSVIRKKDKIISKWEKM